MEPLERGAELARIEAVLAEAALGHGRLALLEGPAGIGKSALLDGARGRAEAGPAPDAAEPSFVVLHGLYWRDRVAAFRRATEAAAGPTREQLGFSALVALFANEPADVVADLALRALAAGPGTLPDPADLPWSASACGTLMSCERFDEVLPVLDEAARVGRRTGDPVLVATALMLSDWASLRRGRPGDARADAAAVATGAELAAPWHYRLYATAALSDALVEQAAPTRPRPRWRPVAGRPGLDPPLIEGESSTMIGGSRPGDAAQPATAALLARGRLWLAQRRPREALADALEAGDALERMGASCPGFQPWRQDAALARLALGDADGARALAAEEVALARAGAAAGAARRRAPRGRRAAGRPGGDRAAGDRREAAADRLSGAGALTASERRVAALAAGGRTNREIAQELFVTARTVETHLTSIYRKLGVAPWQELADALGEPASA